MEGHRYLSNASSLTLDEGRCVGCGMCDVVCPHRVFAITDGIARVKDLDGCMECGACAKNCAAGAIGLKAGVGCASYILQTWIRKDRAACGCGGGCC